MDTKKLRQKILDLAIRGKLLPQDPNDEPASVLLERIREEKERLIKEGKIKRSKKAAADDGIEAPFEIPEGWEWVRLDDIAFITKLAGFEYTNYIAGNLSKTTGVPLFKGKNVQDGKIVYEFESYIPKNISEALPRSQVYKKCLLTPYVGTIGNVGIHEKEGFFHLGSNVGKIELFNDTKLNVLEEYVRYFLMSNDGYKELTKHKKATAQESISIDAIRDCNIPLPPIKEQIRIISQIDYWLSQVISIEDNENGIIELVDKAKSKILDLAIHGKLVPQDPNDEPAINLLKRINPKFEPCDETPWDLPNNWCWTTLGNISNYGKCTHVEAKDIPNDSWVLELEDIEKDTAKLLQRVTCTERDIKGVRSVFRRGDILFSKLRTYLNKVLVAPEDGYCSSEIVPISLCDSLSSHYINHVLRSKYFVEYTTSCGYGVKMPRLSTADACKGLIPLPPKKEQLRIVAKIEELFAVLDGIKESLE